MKLFCLFFLSVVAVKGLLNEFPVNHTDIVPNPGVIDFHESVLVVGNYDNSIGGIQAGVAYIFDCTSGSSPSCTERTEIFSPEPHPNAQFGSSVAIGEHFVAISAVSQNVSGKNAAGQVFLFNCTETCEYLTILNTLPTANDLFGKSVSIHNQIVVVGIYFYDIPSPVISDAGAVAVFQCIGSECTRRSLLFDTTITTDSNLGFSVDVYDNIVIAGAPYRNSGGFTYVGAVYVYHCPDYSTDSCIEKTKLLPASVSTNDILFGTSVRIFENIIVANSYWYDSSKGAVFVYQCTDIATGTCPLRVTLTDPLGQPNDNFGFSVGIFRRTVVVGSKDNGVIASSGGNGFVYDCTELETGECILKFSIFPEAVPLSFYIGTDIAVAENFIFIGRAPASPSIYGYTYNCTDCCPVQFEGNFCENCITGFNGTSCNECATNYFGASCESCDLCVHGTCDQSICECEEQWDGDYCEHCASTYFGNECQFDCSYCVHGTCSNGVCECDENYVGFRCHIFEPVC